MINHFLKDLGIDAVESNEVAKFLQGKSFAEMRNVLKKVCIIMRRRKVEITTESMVKYLNDIEKDRKLFGEKAVRIPEVRWADVGGLADAKDDIL
jgi:SpoVK/Ycf46/Vps4 family AAA+-type ATPase